MRIAVMADSHSNHIALETCFAEAQRRNAEELIFPGDYLGDLAYQRRKNHARGPEKDRRYISSVQL